MSQYKKTWIILLTLHMSCSSTLQANFYQFCFPVRATILVPHVEENYACLTFAYTRSTMCTHFDYVLIYS